MKRFSLIEIVQRSLHPIFVYKRAKILYMLILSILILSSIAGASPVVAQDSIQNPADTFSDKSCSGSECALGRAIPSQNLATIVIESQRVGPGDTFIVSIMAAVDEELSAATLDVIYDSSLFKATSCQLDRDGHFSFRDCNTAPTNLLSFGLLAVPGISGTLVLANITFEHIGQSLGTYDLRMDIRTFADPGGKEIPFTQTDSKITITYIKHRLHLPTIMR